ncbi:putative DNA polymerase delta subunit 4 [Truncatella angustata]|uniref:DNA polymerase delta subunit 4 n=1 Tax=Truncatella angustata TaxID=152316 RepID=A0A9P8RHG5_9PEZI|nr:putative DNA polymerase delta subunit 4 [Truncatella angustata]KAH6645927.1 putative DNA polymerase delta subunit 4 [Truncatella angustata]
MPVTRRSSGGARSSNGKQSTLSFNHRVTKSVPKSAKAKDTTPIKASPLKRQVKEEDLAEEDVRQEEIERSEPEPVATQVLEEPREDKSDAELRAARVSDRQISAYWNKLERERKSKRVHQEDLTLAEKVLRYFDVSNQYGPCVGIERMKRWQRADRLGLNPPVEVLAVLLKEEEKHTKDVETAHIDYILNSTAVGATS